MSLELCGRIVDDIARRQRVTYDMPCLIHGDTGTRYNGNDYYQAMIMWSFRLFWKTRTWPAPVNRAVGWIE